MPMKRMPNSIDTLSPNNRFVTFLITRSSGDRGRVDSPNSSDGVVTHWSLYLDGAKSEKIVPSSHGANQNPEGMAEVARILKQHVGSKG
jgi:hypothetical protein